MEVIISAALFVVTFHASDGLPSEAPEASVLHIALDFLITCSCTVILQLAHIEV